MTFHYKVFSDGVEKMLAIADASLVGRTLKKDNLKIEISSDFYGNEKCGEEEALALAGAATIINAIGSEIIKVLMENRFVEKERLIYIGKTPHAQVVASI